MRIYRTDRHSDDTQQDLTVGEAIEMVTDGSDYDRGQVEEAQATANNATAMVAELIQLLHDKGTLTDLDVGELLQSGENSHRIDWEIK